MQRSAVHDFWMRIRQRNVGGGQPQAKRYTLLKNQKRFSGTTPFLLLYYPDGEDSLEGDRVRFDSARAQLGEKRISDRLKRKKNISHLENQRGEWLGGKKNLPPGR